MKLDKRINVILLPAIMIVFFTFSFFYYQSMKKSIIDSTLSDFSYKLQRFANGAVTKIASVESMINHQLQSKEAADIFMSAKEGNLDIRLSAQFLDRFVKSKDSESIQDIAIFNLNKQPISYINFEDPFADASVSHSSHLLIDKINNAIVNKSRQRIFANYYQITSQENISHQLQLYRIFSPYLLISEPSYNYTNDLVIVQTRLKHKYFTKSFSKETSLFKGFLSFEIFPQPLSEHSFRNQIFVKQTENTDSYDFSLSILNGWAKASLNKAFFKSTLTNLKIKIGLITLSLSLFCYLILHLIIYRQIIRPITKLAEGVDGIKQGNNEALSPLNTNDEVAELNNSYLALIERIQQLANNDELTGLANRAYFNRVLDKKLDLPKAEKETLGLLFIDLDNFKYVNDHFGHKTGDNVLIAFAKRLTRTVRETNSTNKEQCQCIARLGGDEFVVLFKGLTNVEELETIVKRIIELFKHGFEVDDNTYDVHASIGIAFQTGNKLQSDLFLQQADTAMYAAKKGGKNNYCIYDESLDNELKEHKYIESEVIKSLRENSLFLVFLPSYNTGTLKIQGFETLLRAPELDKKSIGPEQFIPIAEQTDLITKIDLWVINEALSKLTNLINQQGFDGTLSINISSRNLFNDNFYQDVSYLMKRHNIPPYRVIFEIAEASLFRDNKKVLLNLTQLKSLGIKITIDNFGINHSTFTHLNSYPLDTLKIDRSFIKQMQDAQAGNKPLIDIIYELANIHGLDIAIEGIQSQQELNYVKNLGCNTVQGFYLSKPLEWHQVQALVNTTNISYLPTRENA